MSAFYITEVDPDLGWGVWKGTLYDLYIVKDMALGKLMQEMGTRGLHKT
jgi:hypothetical protein